MLRDHRLDEVSGIARGIRNPGVFFVQNDGGDPARFFALDARTGRVRAVCNVPAARNVDWEDLAVAPGVRGAPALWIGDIGDNDRVRSEVRIYRVPEPELAGVRQGGALRTGRPAVWRLRYPDGPRDAESLAVSPTGRAYIVTKSPRGPAGVYAVPAVPDRARVQLLRRIAAISLPAPLPLIPAGYQRDVTGAAVSPDGAVFALRTYTAAYVWPVSAGDLPAALRARPTPVDIPLQPQGEGVTVDGHALVLDSEHVGSAVVRVALPDGPPDGLPAPPPSRAAARPRPTGSSAAVRVGRAAQPSGGHPLSVAGWALAAAAGLALAAGAGVIVRRRLRPRG